MESEKILSSNMQSLLLRKYNEIGVAKIFNTSIQPTARKRERERLGREGEVAERRQRATETLGEVIETVEKRSKKAES